MPTWRQIPSFILLGIFLANVFFDFGLFEKPYKQQQKIEQTQKD